MSSLELEDENSNEIVDVLSISPRKDVLKAPESISNSMEKITSFETLLDVVNSELQKSDATISNQQQATTAFVNVGLMRNPESLQQDVDDHPGDVDFDEEDDFREDSPILDSRDDDDDGMSVSSSVSSIGVARKDKSLGLLCHRFLSCMQEQSANGRSIHLETTAQTLQVEKRRIYDIVNVMEALEAMKKQTKSFYSWSGLDHLPHLMFQLKEEAIAEKLPAKIGEVEKAMCSFTELIQRRRVAAAKIREKKKKSSSQEYVGTTLSQDSGYSSCGSQDSLNHIVDEDDDFFRQPDGPLFIRVIEEDAELRKIGERRIINRESGRGERQARGKITEFNSLSLLCRRFLMVLLCAPTNGKVSLDVASTLLVKDPDARGFEPPSRSKCRRLYDIANVLVAMNLIKKVHYLFGTKKIPLFVYCGPEPLEDRKGNFARSKSDAMLPSPSLEKENSPHKAGFRRHSSLLAMCEVAAKEQERIHKQTRLDSRILISEKLKEEECEEKPLNLVLKDQKRMKREEEEGTPPLNMLPKSDYRVNRHGLLLRPEPGIFPTFPLPAPPPGSILHRPLLSTGTGLGSHTGLNPQHLTVSAAPAPTLSTTGGSLLSVPFAQATAGYLVPSGGQYFSQGPIPRVASGPWLAYPRGQAQMGPFFRPPPQSLQSVWSAGGVRPNPMYSSAPFGAVPSVGAERPPPMPWGVQHNPRGLSATLGPDLPKKRLLEPALANPEAKRFSAGKMTRKSVIIPSILKQNQPIGKLDSEQPIREENASAFASVTKTFVQSPIKVDIL